MCAFDLQEELGYLMGLIELFQLNGAKCCVVELSADFDVRLIRNVSEHPNVFKLKNGTYLSEFYMQK